jgi:hypothetical protein
MPNLTVQSLLNSKLGDYLIRHKLPLYQLKALDAITRCRTRALGGHSVYCENGHLHGVWYNSCKHRNCPQCHAIGTERWLLKLNNLILDTTHHHWVFTIPHDLLPLWRFNRRVLQKMLFDSANETIKKLSSDPKYLGAIPGYLLALHTWARNLVLHPHIHCLITHGGVNTSNSWVTPKRDIFIPAKVLMKIFRGKLLEKIRNGIKRKQLAIPTASSDRLELNLCNKLGRRDWILHCCKPYTQGQSVAKYLARYIKGGAVKNSQLISLRNNEVTFRYKSHQTKRTEYLKLNSDVFIGRLLDHISVPKLMTLRRFGLYHPIKRAELNTVKRDFSQPLQEESSELGWAEFSAKQEVSICCRHCQGKLVSLIKRSAYDLMQKMAV